MRHDARKPVSLGGRLRVASLPAGAEDATLERLRHALRDGEAGIEGGTRRLADPFEVLRNRQKLDSANCTRNDILWAAGDRFRRHWHGAALDALTALDFSREHVDGGGGQGGSPTEAVQRHRDSYRRACAAVGERLLPVMTGMVVAGRPALALRHLVDETAHARTAEAIVVERLREALHRLVDHWGMAPREAGAVRPRGPRATPGGPPRNRS